jgi:hypothetical protein
MVVDEDDVALMVVVLVVGIVHKMNAPAFQ